MKITYVDGKEIWKYKARYSMKDNDDLEILRTYNSEIRGFYNYYSIANNSSIINSFKYIMEYSMYKTYATKYRTTKHNMIEKYRINKDFGAKYQTKDGKEKVCLFYNEGFKRKDVNRNADVDNVTDKRFYLGRTSLIQRLEAGRCELCGDENVPIEIHHVRKLKNLNGKKFWEKFMIARRRKTLALCHNCHVDLHNGRLDWVILMESRVHWEVQARFGGEYLENCHSNAVSRWVLSLQQEGRILRQGNQNKKVKIFRYVTENSFDAYLWQILENKQKFISQIMTSKSPVRACKDIDDTALNYAEVKALATGNPYIKEKMSLDMEVSKLKLMRANYNSQKYRLEEQIVRSYPAQIKALKERITGLSDDASAAELVLDKDK